MVMRNAFLERGAPDVLIPVDLSRLRLGPSRMGNAKVGVTP